jgi:hypothetical protein
VTGGNPVVWFPDHVCDAGIEIAVRLGAIPMAPAPVRLRSIDTRPAVRRVLAASKIPLFECSEEVFDKHSLSRAIVELTLSDLTVHNWAIRVNSGSVGWLSTGDFVLLEKLRQSAGILTEKDLENENFRESLRMTIESDLAFLIFPVGNIPKKDFLNELFISGAIVEAGPTGIRSAPAVAFFVPPSGSPQIVGTWECLFLGDNEPFASIHPAFVTSSIPKLKEAALNIAADCSTKRHIGTNVVQFWDSMRMMRDDYDNPRQQRVLTPGELYVTDKAKVVSHYLVEYLLNRGFEDATMSYGPARFVFVQQNLVLPGALSVGALKDGLVGAGLRIDHVLIFPDFTEPNVISLAVVEQTPERLVSLVYSIMVAFADSVFGGDISPAEPIFRYCHAIEFLKSQIDVQGTVMSTVLTGRVKQRDLRRKREEKLFRFSVGEASSPRVIPDVEKSLLGD